MVVPRVLLDQPGQDVVVDVHYSGMYGTAATPDPNAGASGRIARKLASVPPTVVVLAEPRNHAGMPGGHAKFVPDWSNALEPRAVAKDALAGFGFANGYSLTVSGHSAGGRAIAHMIAKGKLNCDRLELQDSLYGQKDGKSCARAVLRWAGSDDGRKCRQIVYIHSAGGQNGEQDLMQDGLALAGGQRVERHEVRRHYDAAFWVPGRNR